MMVFFVFQSGLRINMYSIVEQFFLFDNETLNNRERESQFNGFVLSYSAIAAEADSLLV